MTPVEKTWKNADGSTTRKWRIRYKDAEGRSRDKLFDTRREAQAFVTRLEKLREAHRPVTERLGLWDAAERWIAQGRSGRDGKPPLEPKTVEEYSYLLSVLKRTGADVVLSEASEGDFERIRDRLLEEAKSRGNAIRVWGTLVKPVMSYARRKGWTHLELPRTLTIHRASREEDPEERFEVHTPEQMRVLLALASAKMKHRRLDVQRSWRRFGPLLHLLVYSGMRSSELRGLPIGGVDIQAGSVRIRQRADEAGRIGPPKSRHAYRTIILPKVVLTMLAEWIASRGGEEDSALLFQTKEGKPLPRKFLFDRMWKPLQEEAAVPVLGLHSTRHFFASRMIAKQATLLEIQKALGHHDPSFTMKVYGHLFGGEEAERRRHALASEIVV
ncbi:tyrosine integrase [Microcystis phage Mwe-JY26]